MFASLRRSSFRLEVESDEVLRKHDPRRDGVVFEGCRGFNGLVAELGSTAFYEQEAGLSTATFAIGSLGRARGPEGFRDIR